MSGDSQWSLLICIQDIFKDISGIIEEVRVLSVYNSYKKFKKREGCPSNNLFIGFHVKSGPLENHNASLYYIYLITPEANVPKHEQLVNLGKGCEDIPGALLSTSLCI